MHATFRRYTECLCKRSAYEHLFFSFSSLNLYFTYTIPLVLIWMFRIPTIFFSQHIFMDTISLAFKYIIMTTDPETPFVFIPDSIRTTRPVWNQKIKKNVKRDPGMNICDLPTHTSAVPGAFRIISSFDFEYTYGVRFFFFLNTVVSTRKGRVGTSGM